MTAPDLLDTLPRRWRGRFEIGGRSLRTRLNLPVTPDGVATVDLVDSGVVAIPVEGLRVEADELRGTLPGGSFALRIGDRELVGTHEAPLGLRGVLRLSSADDAYLDDITPRLLAGRPDEAFRGTPLADLGDGWTAGTVLDARPLQELGSRIVRREYPAVDDVLIARGGELVFEEYFYGRTPDQLHTFQSCTKSITALVAGVVVDAGLIRSLDDPVWRYLGNHPDSRWVRDRYDVTVRQLLAMSVGLEWEEEVPYTDPANDNTRMNLSGDWIGYVLDRPLRPDFPRGRWQYQSGLTLLLGEVLRAASGRRVDELAAERLFGPLGITDFHWHSAPDGTLHTGGGLSLRPRDALRLGQLLLQEGEWQGRRLLSRDWVRQLSTEQSRGELSYSFQWFLLAPEVAGRTHRSISASGYGGQGIHVLPELDAVVVSNATDYLGEGAWGEILVHHAIPALTEAS